MPRGRKPKSQFPKMVDEPTELPAGAIVVEEPVEEKEAEVELFAVSLELLNRILLVLGKAPFTEAYPLVEQLSTLPRVKLAPQPKE